MAKNVVCTNLSMAYSSNNWAYNTGDNAYAGFAGGTLYGVTILRFTVPDFSGASEALRVGMAMSSGVGENVTLRWALCSSDANRDLYKNTTEEVTDKNRVDGGTVRFEGLSNDVETRSFSLPTKKLKAGTWYLILWAAENTGISLKYISSAWGGYSVSLDYNSGCVRIQTADGVKRFSVYNGERKRLRPYIKTESGIKPVS